MRSGRALLRNAARTPGRILPAAHPHTQFTTTLTVPFWATAASTSAAVRASAIPAEVSSCRIGAIIISGYILCLPKYLYTILSEGKHTAPRHYDCLPPPTHAVTDRQRALSPWRGRA